MMPSTVRRPAGQRGDPGGVLRDILYLTSCARRTGGVRS
jgi:hypothetical protein